MNLKPIKTKRDYQQALERLEIIFDAKRGTKEGDELEILSKKRKLSLQMIRQFHEKLNIPTDVLIQAY